MLNRSKRFWLLSAVCLLLVSAALNPWLTASAEDISQYQYYIPDYASKAEVLEAANGLNERINEEGIVLLKNTNKALPLAEGAKISVFGKNSVNLVYGGTGSGMKSDGTVTIYESLAAAGFSANPALKAFYENNSISGAGRPVNPSMGAIDVTMPTGETPQAVYTQALKDSYAQYKDAALVVFSRIGGEGFDLPRKMETASGVPVSGARNGDDHYLQLDKNEADLLAAVCAGFDNVIVILNSGAPMELGFLDDSGHYAYHTEIKGALWIGNPGAAGINALGRVLKGTVNPSGRLADTYARNFKNDPSWNNFGNNLTQNGNRYTDQSVLSPNYFVEYEEGIYTGYRYYETRGFTDGETWYQNNVVYPFGYGLSYSSFDWQISEALPSAGSTLAKDGTIRVNVKVTNTGAMIGKDVVQLYYTALYFAGGIEKAYVVLGDFAKTGLLPPQTSEIVTLELKVSDMASYDYSGANRNGFKGYELEAGSYKIYIGRNAHEAWNGGLSVSYSVPLEGYLYQTDADTAYEIRNRFDDVSGNIPMYMSRRSFETTWPSAPTAADRAVSSDFLSLMGQYTVNDTGKPWETDIMPAQGMPGDVILSDLFGKAYDDPLWDELLDRLTVSQMKDLIKSGAFRTVPIIEIGKPETIDTDGSYGFVSLMGSSAVYDTCFYAGGCVVAATWNKGLAYEMGEMIGNEALIGDERGGGRPYSGWYAPSVNIHRSPFAGRNSESYSEDGLLSGKIAAGCIAGARNKGVYAYVKHFALNEQETNRDSNGLATWANEQSMREIYFKPFELAVKEGGANAVMSSFNRIGTVWAGGSYELLTEILRNEWGFKGMVITSYNLNSYMSLDQMIRAGGDLNFGISLGNIGLSAEDTATQVSCIRRAAKNILYTVANSNAMNGIDEGGGETGDALKFASAENGFTLTLGASVNAVLLVKSAATDTLVLTAAFSLQSGSLPPGLTLGPRGGITGVPSALGEYRFTVRASAQGLESADKEFIFTVAGINYCGKTLPFASLNESYSISLGHAESFGVTEAVSYALKPGSVLPAGLELNTATGAITGTPSETGMTSFIIVASAGAYSCEAVFSIGVTEFGGKGDPGEKGNPGNDGKTPRIGENGNWWVGDTDTGVKAQGSGSGCAGGASALTLMAANLLVVLAVFLIRKK